VPSSLRKLTVLPQTPSWIKGRDKRNMRGWKGRVHWKSWGKAVEIKEGKGVEV